MPCQTQTSQQPQQPTTVLPQNLPKTQADWQRFLQRMNELLGSINNAQYATGVNAVPTEYAVYDGTSLPALRITGATSAFDTAHEQFGVGSLQLTATASTVTVELAASGYPITLHPNWKWIASLFLLTSAASITGKLSVVSPAQQYDVDISGSPGASWSRLYGDYDLTADASTSCTLLLTLTGVTIGQVFNVEGWMLEPSQGAVLPSPFIMTSGPRTWNQVVGSDAVNTNITTAQSTATTANTTANTANTLATQAPIINGGFDATPYGTGWTMDSQWTVKSDGLGPGVGAGYAQFTPNGSNGAIYNGGRVGVVTGQTYKAQALIRASSANGSAYARIRWLDATGTEIAHKNGNVITGSVTTGSYAIDQAPSGAVYAATSIEVDSCTTGTYQIDNVVATLQPSTVDEVPDGSTYGRPWLSRLNGGRPWIDFSEAIHANKTQDFVPDGSTYMRSIQLSHAAGALTVDNATFQQSASTGWTISSGASSYTQSVSPSPSIGAQYAVIASGSGGPASITANRVYSCNPGDFVSVGGIVYAFGAVLASIQADFYTGAGAYISSIVASSSGVGWTAIQKSGVVPAAAGRMQLSVQCHSASSFTGVNYVWASINDVRVAGSGARVGDQRNLLQRTITNYPSKVSPGVSYSASAGTPATATISVAAFTALLGSVSVSYNAASASVTGTNGTNVNYYLYFNDPTYAGGTQTLVATTNQNDLYSGDGYVYVGYVTVAFPSSGSGSGGGTGCPLRTAWVIRRGGHGRPQHVRAGKVRVGDWLLRTDGKWAEVTFSRPELQPCVRLVADGFGTLGCSISAPMQLRDGSALSIACLAREVVVSRNGTRGHAAVTDLHDLGDQWVQHITLANAPDDFFWTGDAKDALFGHHNAKPP